MEKIGIIGAGVVGLKLAISLSSSYTVLVYDINPQRILSLKKNQDTNLLIDKQTLKTAKIGFYNRIQSIQSAKIFIISVPTELDSQQQPNLQPLKSAMQALALILKSEDIVIIQSSVFPGTTEKILIPVLEQESGLKLNEDFFVAYSPERYSPQDARFLMEDLCRVIAVSHPKIIDSVRSLFLHTCPSTYLATSIAVAECSKMLENIQRNVNIALMNEFSQLTHALHISLHEVIQAASTKPNFHVYHPGFVGGYCLPINLCYMIHQAITHTVPVPLMQASLQVNEGMPEFVFQAFLKLYLKYLKNHPQAKIGIFGLSFKPNIRDTRHSLSLNLVQMMRDYDIHPLLHDPFMTPNTLKEMHHLDICLILVKHQAYIDFGLDFFIKASNRPAILMDVAQIFVDEPKSSDLIYWAL